MCISDDSMLQRQEKWALVQGVARQLAIYRTRGKDFRDGHGRDTLDSLEKEILPYILRPYGQRSDIPEPEFGAAMVMMHTLFELVAKEVRNFSLSLSLSLSLSRSRSPKRCEFPFVPQYRKFD